MDINFEDVKKIPTVILGFIVAAGAVTLVVSFILGIAQPVAQTAGVTNSTVYQNALTGFATMTQSGTQWLGLGLIVGIAAIGFKVLKIDKLIAQ